MVAWGHKVHEDRIGKDGYFAEVGDIVEVVKGRKFPVGMKMVVAGTGYAYRYYDGSIVGSTHDSYGKEHIMFYDEPNKKAYIDIENVRIIAKNEDREDNPEYRNVHSIEVCA